MVLPVVAMLVGTLGQTAAATTLPATSCAMTPVPPAGSLTIVRDGQVLELDGGVERCLHRIGPDEAGRPVWSPDGTRLLLNPARMLAADGTVADTGYLTANAGVHWSMPTGKSLIAPAVKDGRLLKRLAGNAASRLDITFAEPTDAVAYHPAGTHIFASGVGPQGPGLYLATNIGRSPRLLAALQDPASRITEIAAPVDGASVVFVHDHGDLSHLHRLSLPDLTLTDAVTTPSKLSHVVLLASGDVAVRQGDCAGPGTTVVSRVDGSTLDLAGVLPSTSVLPVGELGGLLVVEVRDPAVGCAGPASVALVDLNTEPPTTSTVAELVDAAAVRAPTPAVGELPGDINSQAPG